MPETLPKTSIIAQFLDEGEPLGTLMLDGTEYKITAPEDLSEAEYIEYFQARAEAMDVLLSVYGVENEDGELILEKSVGASDSVKKAKLEALMYKPARRMVEALLGVPAGTFKRKRSKTVMSLYNHCQQLLDAKQTVEPVIKTQSAEEDLEVPLDGRIEQE
jgi:hypothetical protein